MSETIMKKRGKPTGGETETPAGKDAGTSISSVVAKMFLCCLVVLLVQTMIALFPSFVVNKVSHQTKAVGADDPHHNHRVGGALHLADESKLPIVCSHRGYNDANKTVNSTGAALLSLCMQHGICCSDYDVSSTNDGVLVVGTPSDLRILFDSAGKSATGGSDPQVRDYTWTDIQHKDPTERYFTELRTIVDVAVALKGNGKELFMTLEPKASTERLRKTLVDRFTPLLQGQHSDMFAVIARTVKEVPPLLRSLAEGYTTNHSIWKNLSANATAHHKAAAPVHVEHQPEGAGSGDEHGSQNLHDKTIHFAATFRDRELDPILSTLKSIRAALAARKKKNNVDHKKMVKPASQGGQLVETATKNPQLGAEHAATPLAQLEKLEKSQMAQAMKQCSMLCPNRGPKWARYIMPSNKFVKICSQLRHTAMTDFGVDWYRKYFGKCLKVRGSSHAKHILWVLDKQADFSILPPKYHPAFVISNKPVEVRDKLKQGKIVL